MSNELFGTDGIRGPAGTYPLDEDGMVRIGMAAGTYFSEPGGVILVGWDPRKSSKDLVAYVTKGLVSVGIRTHKLGVIPTPGLAYLTRELDAKAGIMITASHNPYTDNGVKIFTPDGRKLSDEDQSGLNGLISSGVPYRGEGDAVEDKEALATYEKFLTDNTDAAGFKGMKIVVDTANGATSGIAGRVFRALGAEVTAMADKPDGRNINVNCGATDPTALQAAVIEHGADAGVAFDGDGDRVILVDSKGRQLNGDHILYILAMTGRHEGVIATIMSNQGLETALKEKAIAFERTPVGDRSVLSALDNTGFRLGGEQSGHIIMPDISPTGDGLLAAILTLSACTKSGKDLSEWYDGLKLLPQALISIHFPDKHLLESKIVQNFLDEESAKLGERGRLNVRASGTEPKVRVMVEASDAQERAERIADRLE
ncbi:MAG TPA: phosphoglucosamine mutase, partial [Candidatus Saccharimonadales bacterium]|nr:phosphoglucosamine mutase [Candidatus Saccharimonadales bacterium]